MTDYWKGIRNGLYIYGIGTLLTLLTHFFLGSSYAHAPPPSFGVIFIFLIIGFVRLVKTAFDIASDRKKELNKGEITIHLIATAGVIIFILWANMTY